MKSPSRWRAGVSVLLISALAFGGFFGKAYFSEGFRGMLGYELKDTLAHLSSHLRALDQGSTPFWDPVYLQYAPRMPQVPLNSPVSLLIFLTHQTIGFPDQESLFIFLLVLLALIQISCTLTMYLFLRSRGFDYLPAVLGGLVYAYNHQTFVYGIRHGYERISAIMLAPLVILSFCRFLEEKTSLPRRRLYFALTALLLGISFAANGDIKPTFYFGLLLIIIALLTRPFRVSHLLSLLVIFALAGGIFLAQGLPTYYALGEIARGEETVASILDYSMRPLTLILTHVSTGFTERTDYPWENTAEFSLSLALLVIVGLAHISRRRMRVIVLVTLGVSYLWILGNHTPLAPLLGNLMKLFALRNPPRIMVLVYFCYAYLAALGVQSLDSGRYNRRIAGGLLLLPLGVLVLYLEYPGTVSAAYVACLFLSYLVLAAVAFGLLRRSFLGLIILFFVLERTNLFSSLEESNLGDPTAFYAYDEIYAVHPRVKAIIADPDRRDYRALFGAKDLPDLFSHNLYLNALTDGIRPIFPYLYFDEEMSRLRKLQEVLFADWSGPMWDLLNVKYFVDLERYFDLWGEEDSSRAGLDHLIAADDRVRVNPGVEKEIFVRYRAELTDDDSFLEGLASGELEVEKVAYLNSDDARFLIVSPGPSPEGREEISVIGRKTGEITVEVTLPREALVVFSEFWFFPWSVEVDGEKAALARTYNVLQAVRVPEGKHRVRFYFNSRHPAFLVPTIISWGLVLILLLYCLYQYIRIKQSPPNPLSP